MSSVYNYNRVLFEGGNHTLVHVPHVNGRPERLTSGVTYSIVDLQEGDEAADRVVASGTATFGSIDATLDASAGPSQTDNKLISVDDASSIERSHLYILRKADGLRELVEAERVDTTGDNVYAVTDLRHDYASGDSLQSIEVSATFPSAEAADEQELFSGAGPYQITWSYTVDGVVFAQPWVFWLTRYTVQPFITERDVTRRNPTIVARSRDRVPMGDAIVAAHDDYLARLEAAGIDPAYHRVGVSAKVAVATRALSYLHRWQTTEDDDEAADRLDEHYQTLMRDLLTGRPDRGVVMVDKDSDTARSGPSRAYGHQFIRRS